MMAAWRQRLVLVLASGFGLGYAPVASGTFGSLPGIVLAAAVSGLPWWGEGLVLAALAGALIPVCGAAEALYGRKDDGRVVADEYVTLPLVLIGLPWPAHPWLLAAGFLVHRVLDVVKPPPARRLQALGGGLGIMIDDVVSSLYGLGLMHAAWWAITRWG